MRNFQKEYYNQTDFWNKDFSKIIAEKERLKEIIKNIPKKIESILDVGCGNGFFINSLQEKRKDLDIMGLDLSKEALKYVKTKKILGNVNSLPFDKKFDLVTCFEVLEHLPQSDFEKAILEIQRVSKRYILITVPNNENIKSSFVRCPRCDYYFNPFFHLRSFNKQKLANLFKKYRPIKIKEIGDRISDILYPRFLRKVYYYFRKLPFSQNAICPKCGYKRKEEAQEKRILIDNKLKSIFHCLMPKKNKKRWLLALYCKKKNE
jgi:ubiquinone/menaquinone biosynthesis C-methylase UbiE